MGACLHGEGKDHQGRLSLDFHKCSDTHTPAHHTLDTDYKMVACISNPSTGVMETGSLALTRQLALLNW